MEPTPPKGSRINKKFNRPFYETTKKTSAEIVSEARSSLSTFDTKRPFTPAETNRSLFSGIEREGRPSSSCSSIALSCTESRPSTRKKLSPIDSGFADLKVLEKKLKSGSAIKSRRSKLSEERLKDSNNNNNSLCIGNSGISIEDGGISKYSPNTHDPSKFGNIRVNSGPKERIMHVDCGSIKQRSNSSGDNRANNKSHQNESTENKHTYFNDHIKPLLRQMELNKLHEDEDALIVNFDVLWKTLEIGNMLGKSKLGSKKRSELLSTIFKCASSDNVILLLKLTRLFLTLEVTGKNLEAVCKLMLKISRDKKHDELFVSEGLIELLLNLLKSPQNLEMTNSLVYLTGSIKFLSMNPFVMNEMIKYDILQSISFVLQYTLSEFTTDDVLNKESCHMLIQVTSALVNIANVDGLKEKFSTYSVLQLIIDLTETRHGDSDYVLNVARLLSKLTMDENVCHEISNTKHNYTILLNALRYNYRKPNITVRICYAFGNIANYCLDLRGNLAFKYNGIKLMLEIADYYVKCLEEPGNSKDNEDVLVKVIRIVANLSIDEKCGVAFANDENCNKMLCHIIDLNEDKHLSDELLISCATTLNNLSYYAEDSSILIKNEEHFVLAMVDMLLSENINCVIEAMRVLGNFTRSKLVRNILMNEEVFDVIINLLDSNNTDVIFSTCGILINIMIDEDNRVQFKKFGGITKLINILKEFAETDWYLGGLICQILWNYSEKIVKAADCFGVIEADDLITLLNELVEPELALDYESQEDLDDNAKEVLKDTWSMQFQPVASQLLRKIDSHHSDLIPIISFPD